MKKLEAIISPFSLDALQEALRSVGLVGMTVSEVETDSEGRKMFYRGAEYSVDLLAKIKIEILIGDDKVAACAEVIEQMAESGGLDSADIFVSTIEDIIRIRTGEHGAHAI